MKSRKELVLMGPILCRRMLHCADVQTLFLQTPASDQVEYCSAAAMMMPQRSLPICWTCSHYISANHFFVHTLCN